MAHSKSAVKRIRQNEKHRDRNRAERSRLRTHLKKLRTAIGASDAGMAKELMPQAMSLVDTLVKKGVLHENAGNRYKSRLARQVAAISS